MPREARTMTSDFPLTYAERVRIEDLIELLIDALDQDAGDPDFEPSLGSTCDHNIMSSGMSMYVTADGDIVRTYRPNLGSQERWAEGGTADLELVNEDGEDIHT